MEVGREMGNEEEEVGKEMRMEVGIPGRRLGRR